MTSKTVFKDKRLRGSSALSYLKIGVLGGSFNPAHSGHKRLAERALKQLNLDQIWWLVSPNNPLKKKTDNFKERQDSVEKLIGRTPHMFVSCLEADLNTNYTAVTLKKLKMRHPSLLFVWIMGADNLKSVHLWKDWKEIFLSVPILVISRPSNALKARLSLAANRFKSHRVSEQQARQLVLSSPPCWCYLTAPLDKINSTELRKTNKLQ